MTVILNSGSTVSLTTGTETTLTNIGGVGRFQLIVDLVNFQNGDAIEFRAKQMVSPGGTARVAEYMGYYGLQPTDDTVKFGSVLNNDQTDAQGLVFTATQTQGTSRSLIWKVVQVDGVPTNQIVVVASGTVYDVRNIVRANVIQIDTLATSGTNATLNLKQLNINNTNGAAAILQGGNSGDGLDLLGDGVGVGLKVQGGLNGDGIDIISQGVGHGISIVPFGTGDGIAIFPVPPSGAAIRFNPADGSNLGLVGNIIGNISGSMFGNVLGYVGQVTGSAMSLISGTAASFDPSTVWSFTGSRSLNGLQNFNLVGNISGTVTNNYNLLQEVEDLVALLAMDERAVMGNVYYVDGQNGSDAGTTPGTRTQPFKTITRANTAAVAHNHDAIVLLPVPNGTNTITETGTINLSKADVSVIGPGYDVIVTNNGGSNKDVFNITAEGVSLRQFRINTAGNSSNGVTIGSGGSLVLLTHLWIEGVSQDGIFISVSSRNRILNNHIYSAGRDAIRVNSGAGTGTYNFIQYNVLRQSQNGINLLGVDASNNIIQHNTIRDNITNGVLIAAGVANTVLTDNRIFNNGTNLSDAGTNTLQQWNWFGTDVLGIAQGVYNLVSGSVVADRVWNYTGTRTSDYLRGLVGVSGTVIADVRSLVGVSGTVVASAVQGGLVTVSGAVVADVRSLVGVSGTVVASAVQGGFVTVSGTVVASAVQGGFVTVSGAVIADVRSLVGVSGTVVVSQNQDKTGYSLSSPQNFNLIGNISGTITNVYNLISGTQASIDYSQVWNYTGSKIVDAVKGGYVNASGVSVNIDYSQIWNYTGSKVVNGVMGGYVTVSGTVIADVRSLVGVSGTVLASAVQGGYVNASGVSVNIDYSQIWNYTGSRALNGQQIWNLSGTISPPITAVATGVVVDYAQIWQYATRTLTDQVFNLPPVEQGNNLNIRRGDTFIWSPTNLGSLANLSKLYFTVKRLFTDLDSESEIQVEKAAGLITINRAPAITFLNGSIVVNDANLGNITITVAAPETAKLDILTDIYYDVQFINTSGTVTTLVAGLVTIDGDATRGTS